MSKANIANLVVCLNATLLLTSCESEICSDSLDNTCGATDDDRDTASDGSNGNSSEDQIYIGAVYSDWNSNSNPGLTSLQYAVEQVNQAQVLSRELVVVPRLFNDSSISPETQAIDLIDNFGVSFLLTEWTSTAAILLQSTHEELRTTVRCNSNSTGPGLNSAEFDVEDVLYRAVGDSAQHAQLLWTMLESAEKTGIYMRQDPWGQAFFALLNGIAQANEQEWVLVDGYEPPATYTKIIPGMERVLEANLNGEIERIVFLDYTEGLTAIVKNLVENDPPFEGTMIAPSFLAGLFDGQTSAMTEWLRRDTNRLMLLTDYNLNGEHSEAYLSELFAARPETDPDSFLTNNADCVYALAVAAMYGEVLDGHPMTNIHTHMSKLKASYLSGDDAILVGAPSVEGLKEVRQAIEAGHQVRMKGAAGPVEFNDIGDRARQYYQVLSARNSENGFAWDFEGVWDPNTGCVRGPCLEN